MFAGKMQWKGELGVKVIRGGQVSWWQRFKDFIRSKGTI